MAFNLLKIEFIAIILACFVIHFTTAFDWKGEDLRWASNCDFVGNDIMTNMPVPGDQCGKHCQNNPSCSHFSWSARQSGTCVLKSSRPTLSNSSEYETLAVNAAAQGSVCGFLHFSWKQDQNWAYNCDFVHSNNLTAVVSKGEECGGLCANSPECTHFTFTVWQGSGMCLMKSGQVSKRDAKYSPHNVCGIMDINSQSVTSATRPTTPSAVLTTTKSKNEAKQSVSSATTTCALLIIVLFLSLWH